MRCWIPKALRVPPALDPLLRTAAPTPRRARGHSLSRHVVPLQTFQLVVALS